MTFRNLLLLFMAAVCLAVPVAEVAPKRATQAVGNDPDDPALWRNHRDPGQSLVLGTNKVAGPDGALVVFGLDGKIRQMVKGIDRPNNVDVEYGFAAGRGRMDIAVVTERLKNRLRVFRVEPNGVSELGVVECCPEPMGVALYRRPRDGAVFAIVAPKGRADSPRQDYLFQYQLHFENGALRATLARRFGQFSGSKEIEAVAVDDALGFVYYSDEGAGIRKYHADPSHPEASKELALFATEAYKGDREGLAIVATGKSTGYLIATDQRPGNSVYHVYDRGTNKALFQFSGGADSTDGIEAASGNFGPDFPHGLFVAMNSSSKNFLLYDWRHIARLANQKAR